MTRAAWSRVPDAAARKPLLRPGRCQGNRAPRSVPSSDAVPTPRSIARLADWLMEAEAAPADRLERWPHGRGGDGARPSCRSRFAAAGGGAHAASSVPADRPSPASRVRSPSLPRRRGPHPRHRGRRALDAERQAPQPTARVAHIGEDPAFLRYPMRSFPSHLSIAASAGPALSALETALEIRQERGKARYETWRKWAMERAASQRAKADARIAPDAPQISPEYLSRCIGEMTGRERT